MSEINRDRRRMIKASLGGLISLTALPALGQVKIAVPDRILTLKNLHTGEQVKSHYWTQGDYETSEIAVLDHLLRDFRADELTSMDKRLFDAIYLLGQQFDYQQPIGIISGYRSPTTNNKLRAMGRNVAKNSYHTRGMAVDISMPGVPMRELRKAAEQLKMGGVGYYPSNGFIHLDTGPVRRWG
jgi:uncharacterized protein YcbK (DUF882 family)